MECFTMIGNNNSIVSIKTTIIQKRCHFKILVLVLLLFLKSIKVSNSFTIIKTPTTTITPTISVSTNNNNGNNILRYNNKNRFGGIIESVAKGRTKSSSIRNNNLQRKTISILQLGGFVDVDTITTTITAITSSSTSSTILLSNSFTDFEYTLQNLANNLASISLDNTGSSSIGSTTTGSTGTTTSPTNILLSLPIMYGAGLLTSASPCVWGLLPLTMSYISQAAGERNDKQTTIPTIAFAAGLATVFCTLGVLAVQLGGVFGSTTSAATTVSTSIFNNIDSSSTITISSSLILALLSNTICLAMGLQLLDFITIRFPSISRDSVRTFFSGNSNSATTTTTMNGQSLILIDATGRIMTSDDVSKSKTLDDNTDTTTTKKGSEFGSLVRTFLLGGSSALVASPCATPVLTSILAYVSSTSNPFLGGLLLLGYTLGYSTPLLIVAATGGQALESLRNASSVGNNKGYALIGPWVTPITGGILLFYGTNGILYTIFGDPSIAGLAIL